MLKWWVSRTAETLNFHLNALEKTFDFSNIRQEYEKKELITQYQESDLAFITRLAHNNGIYFYEESEIIYFYDFYTQKPHKNITYNPNPNNILKEECISCFFKEDLL